MPGIIEQFFQSGLFLEESDPLPAILFVGQQASVSVAGRGLELHQVINPPQTLLVCFLLGLNDVVPRHAFLLVQFMEVFDRPLLESRRNLDAGQIAVNLLFKVLSADALLWTPWLFAFGAMIIGVMQECGIHHVLNRRLAARAAMVLAVGKLELAVAADNLVLFLRRYHAATVAAVNHSGEGKTQPQLGSGVTPFAKKHLDTVVFRLGDHGLVFSLVILSAPSRIFKVAIVKGSGEDSVDYASGHRLTSRLPRDPGAKAPCVVGDFENFRRGVEAGEHQVPHVTHQREAFRVIYQVVLTREFDDIVQVTDRRLARIPTVLVFRFQSTLHVFAQIINILLCHAECGSNGQGCSSARVH